MVNSVVPLSNLNGLPALQKRFAISTIGGEVRVIDLEDVTAIWDGDSFRDLHLYKRIDGSMIMKRHLETLPVVTKPRDDIENFFVDPLTTVFTSTAFSPDVMPDSVLNLWSDPPIQPNKGDWSVIQAHLVDVVCGSCPIKADYLLKFLAHMLQKPTEKPGVMIVLTGAQGIGKGALLQVLQRIWQNSCLFTANIDHVVGRFTGALERSYLVLLDEALFKGDKKSQDRMKSLITEPRCQIEVKYQPARSISSVHRFFATTNRSQFGTTEIDDRRHAFFDVSDCKQNDHAYFSGLFNAINDDQVIAAMIDELVNIDLNDFNVRVYPKTPDHGVQVLQSLAGFEHYWYQALTSGELDVEFGCAENWIKAEIFVSTSTMQYGCKQLSSGKYRYERLTYQEIHSTMDRLCPSATADRQISMNRQKRGYRLPALSVARSEFEQAMGFTVDWLEP